MPKIADPFDDHYQHLNHLPDSTLRDLARNDAAPRDYRKFAVELLWVRKSPYVKHTDLREFVQELEAEYEGISFEFPAPVVEDGPGPLTAGITTKTMFGSDEVPTPTEAPDEDNPPPKPRKKKPDDA
jgi:hypothetical protein